MLRGGMAHFEERHSPFQKTESRNCEIVSGPSETACKGKGCILQLPAPRGRGQSLARVTFIGEGNGNPLQCSCLENPRDGGAWWAAVYGVAQSRTRSDLAAAGLLFIITNNNVKRNVTEHQKAISVISKYPNEYVVESCLFQQSRCQSWLLIKAPEDIV